jgi:hypothetical protein
MALLILLLVYTGLGVEAVFKTDQKFKTISNKRHYSLLSGQKGRVKGHALQATIAIF